MNVLAGWIVTTNEVFVSKPLRRSGTAVEDLSLDNELKKPLRSRPTTAAAAALLRVQHSAWPGPGGRARQQRADERNHPADCEHPNAGDERLRTRQLDQA